MNSMSEYRESDDAALLGVVAIHTGHVLTVEQTFSTVNGQYPRTVGQTIGNRARTVCHRAVGPELALDQHHLVDGPRRPDRIGADRCAHRTQIGRLPVAASVRCGTNAARRHRARDPTGASRASTAAPNVPSHSAPACRPSIRIRARRGPPNVSAPPSCSSPGPRTNGSDGEAPTRPRRRRRVAEELHRDVPLVARRRADRAGIGTAADALLDRVEHDGGRPDRDERARHRATLSQRQNSLPSGSSITIHGSRRLAHRFRAHPRRAERDEARRLGLDVVDDEIEVHAVLHDLRLGHLLEHDLRSGRAVGRDARLVYCPISPCGRSRAPRSRTARSASASAQSMLTWTSITSSGPARRVAGATG